MAACGCGKKLHAGQMRAIAAAIRNSARFGKAFRAYPCPRRAGWHLTTQPRREGSPPCHQPGES